MNRNLHSYEIEWYIAGYELLGKNNLLLLLVPILAEYEYDYYDFIRDSFCERGITKTDTWLDSLEEGTDKRLLLGFRNRIYTEVRKEKGETK